MSDDDGRPKGMLVLVVAAIALGIVVLISAITLPAWDHYHFGWIQGGEYHDSVKLQRAKVKFIRSHPCSPTFQSEPRESYDSDLQIKRESGFKIYSCQGFRGVIVIHDYELQP